MLWVVSSMRWSTSRTLLLVAWMAVTSAASSASGDLGRSGDSGRCGVLPLAGASMRMERSRLGGSLVPGGSRLCAGQVGGWTQAGQRHEPDNDRSEWGLLWRLCPPARSPKQYSASERSTGMALHEQSPPACAFMPPTGRRRQACIVLTIILSKLRSNNDPPAARASAAQVP